MTAVNRLEPDTYDATPVQMPDALVNMVVGVCQKQPNVKVETVVYSVIRALEAAKSSDESPEIAVTAAGQSTVIRKDTFIKLQQALITDKYLNGTADGAFGPNVQAALLKFQKAEHLPETGIPDPDTVIRALVEHT